MRWPRCIAKTSSFVLRRKVEQPLERSGRCVDGCVRVTDLGKTLRHSEDGKIRWIAVGNLMPLKRRRDASVGKRTHRIGGGRRAVLRILVVVQEDAVPFFLPPF